MTLLLPQHKSASGVWLYRHAQRHRWPCDARSGVVAAGSVLGPSLRVPGTQGESAQDCVLGWWRSLPVHQAAGARRVSMATGGRARKNTAADLSAAFGFDRWGGLARAATVAPRCRGLRSDRLTHRRITHVARSRSGSKIPAWSSISPHCLAMSRHCMRWWRTGDALTASRRAQSPH